MQLFEITQLTKLDVYVGIVGWIYKTKIDPISTPYPCFLTFLSFSLHRNVFPYIIMDKFEHCQYSKVLFPISYAHIMHSHMFIPD